MSLAVVTGATSGIGHVYARRLASVGHELVIAARSSDRLRTVADELSNDFEVHATPVAADLSTAEGVANVVEAGRGATVVVANAGSSLAARAGAEPWAVLDRLSYLLGPGVAQLCEGLIPPMVANGSGRITIVASIGALVPMPKSAIYSAAKAYAVAYGRSVQAELDGRGIRVCTVCPGYVRTELHRSSGLGHLPQQIPNWLWIDAEDVVEAAERGLDRGKSMVVPGAVYRMARPFLQSSAAGSIWRQMAKRRS